jgi:hypothetical protein
MVTPIVLLGFNLFGHFTSIDWMCFLDEYHQCNWTSDAIEDSITKSSMLDRKRFITCEMVTRGEVILSKVNIR